MDPYTLTGLLQSLPIGYVQQALDDSPAEDVAAFERVLRRAQAQGAVNRPSFASWLVQSSDVLDR